MTLDARKKELLGAIVREYVRTAEPVGSKHLAEEYFDVSAATVRNDMAALEQQGLVCQPHTSAGRVPTERGFQYFVDTGMSSARLVSKARQALEQAAAVPDGARDRAKALAKSLAELSGQAVFVAFGARDSYYTGLSGLFSQPEFQRYDMVASLSAVIDHLDEATERLPERASRDVTTFIGQDNPFGADCSVVAGPMPQGGMLGILGPLRMDYGACHGMLAHALRLLTTPHDARG